MITQLDQPLINKIAAGEVVERPLSVVKELLENAIDAGASTITVEIADGGLSSVRVTDNGAGIPADQILLAFARHATSKIASLDDLFDVGTLGFRGEALSSIAAVAQVEMITRPAGQVMGVRVEIHGGEMVNKQDIGAAGGTTVVVKNLFYNTPARRKFLKKPASEAGYIAECLQKLALGNPRLTIRYINNGQIAFQTNGRDLKTAILGIYGHETAAKLVGVDAGLVVPYGDATRKMILTGFIGKPEIARGNRQRQSFFINGRLISSKLLTQAVEEATKTMLPGGKFPVYVLNLALPNDVVDVNVHPTKMDVRFADEAAVYRFIMGAVREGLTESNLIPEARFGSRREREAEAALEQMQVSAVEHRPLAPQANQSTQRGTQRVNTYRPGSPYFTMETKPEYPLAVREDKLACATEKDGQTPNASRSSSSYAHPHTLPADVMPRHKLPQPPQPQSRPSQPVSPEYAIPAHAAPDVQPFFNDYHVIGLIFGTYWLITQKDSMYLIDQHAAHERVLYEEILETSSMGGVQSQQLLMPTTLHLTGLEVSLLVDNLALFSRFGFDFAGLDEGSPKLTAVPYLFKGPASTSFFTDLLDKINDTGFSKAGVYAHKTESIAMAACKAAVKAGDNLSEAEARALVTKMLSLENPFTCPHGRPTIIEITRQELSRRFKRG